MKLAFLMLINPLAWDLAGQDSAILEQLRLGEERGETDVFVGQTRPRLLKRWITLSIR